MQSSTMEVALQLSRLGLKLKKKKTYNIKFSGHSNVILR